MRRIVKIFGFIVIFLLVLLLMLAVALPSLVNQFKPEIEKVVKEQTGLTLALKGDIGLSIYPFLGVAISDVQLDEPNGERFAEVGELKASVALIPLFSGQVGVDRILVSKARLNLRKGEDGRGNWEIISATQAAKPKQEAPEAKPDQPSGELPQLNILAFNIEDTALNFVDQQSGQSVALKDFSLGLEDVSLGAAFPVSLGFVVEAAKPKTTLQASLKSEIKVSKDIKKIALSDLNTQLSVTSEATQGKTLNFDIRTGVEVDLAQQLLAIQEFVLQFENLKVQSDVQVSNFEAPVIQGDLSIPAFSAQALLAKMGTPVSMSDPKALSAVSFKTSMSMRDNLLTIPDIVMALDQTTFRGGVTVNTVSQAITVALSGDRINLDHYLPPGKEGEAAPVPAPVPTDKPQSSGNEPLIPVEVLRPLDLSVSLKLAEATLKDYVTNNMEIYLTAKNGLLELHKADATLYDGTLKTKASLDARTDQVRYSFKNDIMNVNADKFPKSLTRQEFMFGLLKIQPQGKINVNTRYQSQGNSLNSILENGNANLDLYLEKGALEELELLTDLYQLASKFDQNVQDTSKLVAATPFKDLKTQFALEGSQLHHKQYRLQLNRDADLLGSGEVDLAKRTLEYRFNLTPTAEFIEKESKWATAFRNIPLNYVCKADLNQSPVPACKVDRSAIEKAATQAVKDKAKTKAVKEIDRFFDKRKAEKDAKQAENPDAEKSEKQQRKDALEEAGREVLKGLFK